MKGILTDCTTGEKREIEVDYDIVFIKGERVFCLIGGVTGQERFCIKSKYMNVTGMCRNGWVACKGAKDRYDKLFIPAEEMRDALEPYIGNRVQKVMMQEVIISSCRECRYHGYTESNWYCKMMKLGKYTFREITDIDGIHELCPLDDVAI